jgi:hypothetical protein
MYTGIVDQHGKSAKGPEILGIDRGKRYALDGHEGHGTCSTMYVVIGKEEESASYWSRPKVCDSCFKDNDRTMIDCSCLMSAD